ncbi:MAG: SDR family oxidoreductase [Bdellovibrionales bacterium]|nr:SDR family oxidoreductase [Bdellovibrionales bacterium]
MKLKDSKIIVTGGSLGIGKETAKQLVAKGAKVLITGRDAGRLEAAAAEIGAFPVVADVASDSDNEKTIQQALTQLGGLDCLINNAGIGTSKSLLEATREDFRKVFEVNVFGAAMLSKLAAQIFVEQNHGTIVNIASTASLRGYERGSIYSASKFALRSMSECWRAELRKNNIRVIQINPSLVTTAFGSTERLERPEESNKLRSTEIAHTIIAALEMDDRGFIPEVTIHATNPW